MPYLSVLLAIIGIWGWFAGSGCSAQPASTNAVPEPWTTMLHQSWQKHIDYRLKHSKPGSEAFEWMCRAALRHDPLDTSIATNLVAHFYAKKEYVLACAAAGYAQTLGVNTRSRRLIGIWEDIRNQETVNQDLVLLIDTKLEEWGRVDPEQQELYTPEFFAVRERGARKFLIEETRTVELLYVLAETWEALPEEHMAVMAVMSLLQIEPFHEEGMKLHWQLMDTLRHHHLMRATLNFYQTKEKRPAKLDEYLGELGLRIGDRRAAAFYFTSWTRSEPRNPVALKKLGEVLLKQFEYKEAKHVLRRASALPGSHPEVFRLLAVLAEKEGDELKMAAWLSEYRLRTDEAALEKVLLTKPFNKYRRLSGLFQ